MGLTADLPKNQELKGKKLGPVRIDGIEKEVFYEIPDSVRQKVHTTVVIGDPIPIEKQ